KLGMEFVINAAARATNKNQYVISWSSAANKGVNDNTMWGDVVLSGYDGKTRMALNRFPLEQSIRKATPASTSDAGLVRGIWTDESPVDRALAAAQKAVSQKTASQAELD